MSQFNGSINRIQQLQTYSERIRNRRANPQVAPCKDNMVKSNEAAEMVNHNSNILTFRLLGLHDRG